MSSWHDLLHQRRSQGIRLGLGPVRTVADALGLSGTSARAVQVLGTNGKGSTVAMLERGLLARGRRVGTFTSPHLHQIRERVRIDGQMVADSELRSATERVLAVEANLGLTLTFFEVLTCAAASLFRDARPEFWVLEAGLGGRYDATSIFPVEVQLFTQIGLDHQAMLGKDVASIASEKAAAIRTKIVYSVPQERAASRALDDAARKQGTYIRVIEPAPRAPRGLAGDHQRFNAALAGAGLGALLNLSVDPAEFDDVTWPGRLETVGIAGGHIVFDVAHNRDAVSSLRDHFENERLDLVILGARTDKDPEALVALLNPLGVPVVRAPDLPDSSRLDALEEKARSVAGQGGVALVCGSHALVAALRARILNISSQDLDADDLRDPSHRFFAGPG